ncbi:MAG: hypothetical protein R2697_04480 [Ilumatobacteraceae bacterium]
MVEEARLEPVESFREPGIVGLGRLELVPQAAELRRLIGGQQPEEAVGGDPLASAWSAAGVPPKTGVSPASISTMSWINSMRTTRPMSTSPTAWSARVSANIARCQECSAVFSRRTRRRSDSSHHTLQTVDLDQELQLLPKPSVEPAEPVVRSHAVSGQLALRSSGASASQASRPG